MSETKKLIKIKYNNNEVSIPLGSSYQDFESIIKTYLYMNQSQFERASFFYFDEDNDKILLSKDDYEEMLEDNPNFFEVEVPEVELKRGQDDWEENKEKIKLSYKKSNDMIIQKMKEMYQKKIEEKDRKHKEEIKKIKESYKKKFLDFIKENEKIMKENYNKICEIIFEKVKKYLKECNDKYFTKIEGKINESIMNLSNVMKGLDFGEIKKIQGQIDMFFEDSTEKFKNILNDLSVSKINFDNKLGEDNVYNSISKKELNNVDPSLQFSNIVNSGNNFNNFENNNNYFREIIKCSIVENIPPQTAIIDKLNNSDFQPIYLELTIKNEGNSSLPNDCYIESADEKYQDIIKKTIFDLSFIFPGETKQFKIKVPFKLRRKERIVYHLLIFSLTKGKLTDNYAKFTLSTKEKTDEDNNSNLIGNHGENNGYQDILNRSRNSRGSNNSSSNDRRFSEIKNQLKKDGFNMELIDDNNLKGIIAENDGNYEMIKNIVENLFM